MPTIPAPKEQSVDPSGQLPYQSIQSNPGDFGAAIGAGATQAGTDLAQVALRTQDVQNESDSVGAQNQLLQATQDLQNGNKDAGVVGYRTLVGQNAVDALPDYQRKIQDAYTQVRGGLNPAAARLFDFSAMRTMRGTLDSMGSYSASQQNVASYHNLRANVALQQNGAMTYADDPDGFATHMGAVQEASLASSRQLGLGSDATELQRQRDVSQVYQDRTRMLMLQDPIKAADFYQQNIGSIVPDQRYPIEQALKTTTDAQYAKTDGQTAFQTAIGRPSASATPTPVAGSSLPAFDQKKINDVAAFVKAPSPYDAQIAAAAKQYGVSPTEIKIKIGIESGGNPNAVNPQSGATGLGQFMPATATQYGITDRTDPAQSITGIAKFLAAHGGTVGSDMKAADTAYMGTGPTADQYAENTRAVRQAVMGGGAPAPLTAANLEGAEGSVIQQAQTAAEARRPGDAVYAAQTVASARALWAQDLQATRGKDFASTSQVLDGALKTNAMSLADMPPNLQQLYSQLTPQNQASVNAQFARNVKTSNGQFTESNPALVNSLRQRIYLPDGDPQKITDPSQITPYIAHGLNYTDTQHLLKETQDANTPEGNPFLKQVNQVKTTAGKMLTGSMSAMAVQHPELADEAAYRFGADLDNKIKAARAAHIDPQTLFTPGNPNYVLDPNRVATFMPTEAETAAAKVRSLTPPPAPGAVPARQIAPRLPGETVQAYLARAHP